ncbi:unnamed protein product [Rhizophagus irregularis]|nr:unnamed protein product [Rhizophagus irregularis]
MQPSCSLFSDVASLSDNNWDVVKLTPIKQPGCPPLLNSPARQELKAFVQKNVEIRLCAKKLATVWPVRKKQPISAITIRCNLKRFGLSA